MIWLSVSHVSGRTGATSYNCSQLLGPNNRARVRGHVHLLRSLRAVASCRVRLMHRAQRSRRPWRRPPGFVRPASPQPGRLESDPENGWLTVARKRPTSAGGATERPVWRALAAVDGRDTATLKLLIVPAPRGVSISSPSLPPRGGKLPQWRPLHFESSSRISTRKQRSVQSLVAASRMRFTRAP